MPNALSLLGIVDINGPSFDKVTGFYVLTDIPNYGTIKANLIPLSENAPDFHGDTADVHGKAVRLIRIMND